MAIMFLPVFASSRSLDGKIEDQLMHKKRNRYDQCSYDQCSAHALKVPHFGAGPTKLTLARVVAA
jgi:hypothetical protein